MSENISPAKAPKISVPSESVDKVRGSLAGNSVSVASVDFYVAVLDAAGIDPESLSFAETVEVTRRLYADSADFRRNRAEISKAEKDAEKAKAKADRDAKRAKAELAEIEILKAKLAAKGITV